LGFQKKGLWGFKKGALRVSKKGGFEGFKKKGLWKEKSKTIKRISLAPSNNKTNSSAVQLLTS
jgi:hypothetical protein